MQLPTFYLLEQVQGITSEDAAREIAVGIIDPTGVLRKSGATIDICAVKS